MISREKQSREQNREPLRGRRIRHKAAEGNVANGTNVRKVIPIRSGAALRRYLLIFRRSPACTHVFIYIIASTICLFIERSAGAH